MNKEEIIRMAREAGCLGPGEGGDPNGLWEPHGEENITELMFRFAALVAAAKEREMQARVAILHAMYEQACQHRDQLMDERSAAIAAMRGKIQ